MPKIAVCSLFRDNAADVGRCFADRARWQVNHDDIVHVCVEGDSVDGTYEALVAHGADHRMVVAKIDSGAPRYGSVICPERMRVLGRTSNYALALALETGPSHVLWLDADVTTPPDLVPQLLSRDLDVVAPLFYFERSTFFRDTWGYRSLSGDEFTNRPPFCREFNKKVPFQVGSVGLPLIKSWVVKAGARFSEEEEIVGLCRNVAALGAKIHVDPMVYVEHPRMGIEIPPAYERNITA